MIKETIKPLLAAALLALGLSGCTELQNAYSVVTGVSISPTSMIVALNAYAGIEATATNYVILCTPSVNRPKYCSMTALNALVPAIQSGHIAAVNVTTFMAANPGALGTAGLYNALTAATQTLAQIEQTYGVGSK